jgi:hypothetical protein
VPPRDPNFCSTKWKQFSVARDSVGHYRALAGDKGRDFDFGYIREMLAELTCCELSFQPAGEAPGADPPEFKVQFVIGAFVAALIW